MQHMNDSGTNKTVTVAAVHKAGATVNSTQTSGLRPTMFAGLQGGGMSDPCLIKTKGITFDELERSAARSACQHP